MHYVNKLTFVHNEIHIGQGTHYSRMISEINGAKIQNSNAWHQLNQIVVMVSKLLKLQLKL